MEDPYTVENIIDRLGVLMFQTSDNSQLVRKVLWINAELTIVWSLKHRYTQPSYIFNRENPQKSEPQNGPRRVLDFIALCTLASCKGCPATGTGFMQPHENAVCISVSFIILNCIYLQCRWGFNDISMTLAAQGKQSLVLIQ